MKSSFWRSGDEGWAGALKGLHWLIAALVLGMLLLGNLMQELPASPWKIRVYALHKSFGITVLALMLIRLAVRLSVGRPPLPAMPIALRWAAGVSHALLYGAVFTMALSGWVFNSAAGFPLRYFGTVALPALARRDAELKSLAHEVHEFTAWLLIAVVIVHAGAAWWHHSVRRDSTLRHMLPGRGPAGDGN